MIVLYLIFVLATHQDKSPARQTEMTVETEATVNDCFRVLENFRADMMAITSTDAMLDSILNSGRIIENVQNTHRSSFNAVEYVPLRFMTFASLLPFPFSQTVSAN